MGRKKELIIINGRNVYPHDLERTIESEYPDIVRPGSTVAYQASEASVGVVLEVRQGINLDDVSHSLNIRAIRQLLIAAHDVKVSGVDFLKQGSVPKTTSGKLRRVETQRRCRQKDW